MKKSKKGTSFPTQGAKYKRETTNGYFDPTSIPAKIQAKKNAKDVATRIRLAAQGLDIKRVSTRSTEPVQSEAFKKGYCK